MKRVKVKRPPTPPVIVDEAHYLKEHQRKSVREILTGAARLHGRLYGRSEVLDVDGNTLLVEPLGLPYLAKDAPVPPRQPFSMSVYEPQVIRSTMKLPPPVSAFTRGPWAACVVCGEPTRALHRGILLHRLDPVSQHMACRLHRPAREAPNRHDRRRAGLPRPPIPAAARALRAEMLGAP